MKEQGHSTHGGGSVDMNGQGLMGIEMAGVIYKMQCIPAGIVMVRSTKHNKANGHATPHNQEGEEVTKWAKSSLRNAVACKYVSAPTAPTNKYVRSA